MMNRLLVYRPLLVTVLISVLLGSIALAPVHAQAEEVMLLPGMVMGLRHTRNNANYSYWQSNRYSLREYPMVSMVGNDYNGGSGEVFRWWAAQDDSFYSNTRCNNPTSLDALPAGIVLGLMHSMTPVPTNASRPHVLGCEPWRDPAPSIAGVEQVHGGDMGASGSGVGYYWYATTRTTVPAGLAGEYWDYLEKALPRYTVVGLCHSRNNPGGKMFYWRGRIYNACDGRQSPPAGFARVNGGDMGASAGTGYYWYEKMSGPELVYKQHGENYIVIPDRVEPQQNYRRLSCVHEAQGTWDIAGSLYLAGFCGDYTDPHYATPSSNVTILEWR